MKKEIKVFMTNDVTMNGSNYTMDNFYSMNKDDASKLVSEGRAIEYGNDELNTYDKQIEQAVGAYRKQYDKLATSKDHAIRMNSFSQRRRGNLRKRWKPK
jgi:hypothetical protein